MTKRKKQCPGEESHEEVAHRFSQGDESVYEDLLSRFNRMIWKQARYFGFKLGLDDHQVDDLYQEGQLVLLDCARRFDISRGWKFSTFLQSCLRKLCQHGLNMNIIKVPANSGKSDALMEAKQVARRRPCSLHATFQDTNGLEVLGSLGRRDADHLEQSDEHDRAHEMLSILPERVRSIVLARFDGQEFRAIGEEHFISKERVRQIHEKAMRIMKKAAGITNGGKKESFDAATAKDLFKFKARLSIDQHSTGMNHPERQRRTKASGPRQ